LHWRCIYAYQEVSCIGLVLSQGRKREREKERRKIWDQDGWVGKGWMVDQSVSHSAQQQQQQNKTAGDSREGASK